MCKTFEDVQAPKGHGLAWRWQEWGWVVGGMGRREARNRRKRESHISQRMYSEWKGEKGNPRTLGSICSDSEDKGDRGLGDLRGPSRGSRPPKCTQRKCHLSVPCTVITFNTDPDSFCPWEIMKAALFEPEGLKWLISDSKLAAAIRQRRARGMCFHVLQEMVLKSLNPVWKEGVGRAEFKQGPRSWLSYSTTRCPGLSWQSSG